MVGKCKEVDHMKTFASRSFKHEEIKYYYIWKIVLQI